MSNQKSLKHFQKLEDNAAWREACALAEYVYGITGQLTTHGEEYRSASKLKFAAMDLIFFVSQAVGSATPNGAEYEWGTARKNLNALKTLYRFVGREGFLKIDPDVMLRIEKLNIQLEVEIEKAALQTQVSNKAQLDHWREEYSLWAKMNDNSHSKPRSPKS